MKHTAKTSKKLAEFMRGRGADGSIKDQRTAEVEEQVRTLSNDRTPEGRKAYRDSRDQVHGGAHDRASTQKPSATAKGAWFPNGQRRRASA